MLPESGVSARGILGKGHCYAGRRNIAPRDLTNMPSLENEFAKVSLIHDTPL